MFPTADWNVLVEYFSGKKTFRYVDAFKRLTVLLEWGESLFGEVNVVGATHAQLEKAPDCHTDDGCVKALEELKVMSQVVQSTSSEDVKGMNPMAWTIILGLLDRLLAKMREKA